VVAQVTHMPKIKWLCCTVSAFFKK